MSKSKAASPKWGPNTKLVVALSMVALSAALVIRFGNIIVPLIFVFMMSYLLHPVAALLEKRTKLSWRAAVNLVYLILLVMAVGFLVALGVALVQQLQNLVAVIDGLVNDLPAMARDISQNGLKISIGNFTLDLTQLITQLDVNVSDLSDQIINIAEPIISRTATILGAVATSTVIFIAWGAFVFIVSYFILSDAGKVPYSGIEKEIQGYDKDFQRIGRELGRIWNAFLRGQLFLFVTAVILSFTLMAALGIDNALGLAFLVGIAKFVPYLGPIVANLSVALVALFQQENYWNIEPLYLVLIVVIALIVMDQVFDGLIAPRLFGNVLGIHPAAVLVTAIILASLIGIMGLFLAAPVLASAQLFSRYGLRKMRDQDPWPEPEKTEVDIDFPLEQPIRRLIRRIQAAAERRREQEND